MGREPQLLESTSHETWDLHSLLEYAANEKIGIWNEQQQQQQAHK